MIKFIRSLLGLGMSKKDKKRFLKTLTVEEWFMDKLEVAREAVIIYFEENISATRAIEKVKEKYLDTDQSIQGTTLKKNYFENIITQEAR